MRRGARRYSRGIASTPVIDRTRGKLYVVYGTSDQPSSLDNADAAFWLAALDVHDGTVRRQTRLIFYLVDTVQMQEVQHFQAFINEYNPSFPVDSNWEGGPHLLWQTDTPTIAGWAPPTVADGRVIMPTSSGQVRVYVLAR